MKKRALILLTLLATIVIGTTAQKLGRRMFINEGGKIVGNYLLPEKVDSITFKVVEFYNVTTSATEGGTVTPESEIEIEQDSLITFTATPNDGYCFLNWTVNGEIVSTENPYTATITENTEYVANFKETKGVENGHEYVDLGLPSGTKWATCNVGATSPEEYGDYFAWGETETKTTTYDWSTYKYCNGTETSLTKYCTDSDDGTVDNKTTLELEDDAARINWGGNWRMPTRAEQDELRNTNNCTWEWITHNGVKGYKVTSKVNGNSIFLPAAGYRYYDNLYDAGSYGFYWSSSLYTYGSGNAYYVLFYSDDVDWYYYSRDGGQSVRAVFREPYTVLVSSTVGGSATTSSNSVEPNGSVTLTATPNSGYQFVNWTLNGNVVSTSNPYTATITANTEFVANFENRTEYCTKSGNSTNAARFLSTFTLTDGISETVVSDIQTGTRQALYHDKTSVVLETEAGATVSFKELPWVGKWMHGYVFIDYNNDYEFNATLNADGTTGGELVSYNFYSEGGAETGTNSKGETQDFSIYVTASSMPEWTIPSNLAPGDYRMRFNVAWNSIDPCGYAEMGENGGAMVDVTIRIASQAAARTISVSATPAEAGTVTINGEAVESVTAEGTIVLEATAADGYKLVNWTLNGEEVATTATFVDRTEGDKVYVANFVEAYHNGHEYVDLGLPSGTKWATCNVGADTPEGCGDYFAWGETEPKEIYDWSTYKWCNGSSTTLTKYCTDSKYGTVDNKTVLELEDDAARVNWGGKWRMPTKAEQDELRNSSNCIWTWTTQNGVNGYKVTSKINGNSIFLPAADYCDGDALGSAGDNGYYWSSSLITGYSYDAYGLRIYLSSVDLDDGDRYYGQSVRAVCE